jgi:hypothetical protein
VSGKAYQRRGAHLTLGTLHAVGVKRDLKNGYPESSATELNLYHEDMVLGILDARNSDWLMQAPPFRWQRQDPRQAKGYSDGIVLCFDKPLRSSQRADWELERPFEESIQSFFDERLPICPESPAVRGCGR